MPLFQINKNFVDFSLDNFDIMYKSIQKKLLESKAFPIDIEHLKKKLIQDEGNRFQFMGIMVRVARFQFGGVHDTDYNIVFTALEPGNDSLSRVKDNTWAILGCGGSQSPIRKDPDIVKYPTGSYRDLKVCNSKEEVYAALHSDEQKIALNEISALLTKESIKLEDLEGKIEDVWMSSIEKAKVINKDELNELKMVGSYSIIKLIEEQYSSNAALVVGNKFKDELELRDMFNDLLANPAMVEILMGRK